MALTNPSKLINVQELQYFEGKLAAKYQTQTISATGITATSVVGALEELANSISSLPSAIVPKGTKAFAGLTPSTDLAAANVGFMWNISDAFTTTDDFVEGAGKSIPAGANVYVANPSTGVYKYDIFQGMYDLSGYALKSEMSVTPGTGANADKTTIQLKDGTSATVLTTHQDISGKVDKIETEAFSAEKAYAKDDYVTYDNKLYQFTAAHAAGAWDGTDAKEITGDFAMYDKNGNLVDSGKKASDFQAAGDYKTTQTAVTDPTAGSATDTLNFIATISQNENGEITATKQPVRSASASQSGLMSAAHYSKLDAIAYAADSDIDEIFPSA